MKYTKTRIILVLAGIALMAACARLEKQSKPQPASEIRPGILEGYLPVAMLPSSLPLISPPPTGDSTSLALDKDLSSRGLALQGTARCVFWLLGTLS